MLTKEEATMIGFEIVAYSGDARSKLLLQLKKLKQNNSMNAKHLLIKLMSV